MIAGPAKWRTAFPEERSIGGRCSCPSVRPFTLAEISGQELTHDFAQHFRCVILSHQINRKLYGGVEWALVWMMRLRSSLRIALEEDPRRLYYASRLVSLEVNDAWYRESAWISGLDVEEDDIAIGTEKGKSALAYAIGEGQRRRHGGGDDLCGQIKLV